MRRNVSNIGIIEICSILSSKLKTWIEGANEGFYTWKFGKKTRILGGNRDLMVPHQLKKLLLAFGISALKKLLDWPVAIRVVDEIRMVVDHLYCFIESHALDFGHLSLVIGKSDIQMYLWNKQERPTSFRASESH